MVMMNDVALGAQVFMTANASGVMTQNTGLASAAGVATSIGSNPPIDAYTRLDTSALAFLEAHRGRTASPSQFAAVHTITGGMKRGVGGSEVMRLMDVASGDTSTPATARNDAETLVAERLEAIGAFPKWPLFGSLTLGHDLRRLIERLEEGIKTAPDLATGQKWLAVIPTVEEYVRGHAKDFANTDSALEKLARLKALTGEEIGGYVAETRVEVAGDFNTMPVYITEFIPITPHLIVQETLAEIWAMRSDIKDYEKFMGWLIPDIALDAVETWLHERVLRAIGALVDRIEREAKTALDVATGKLWLNTISDVGKLTEERRQLSTLGEARALLESSPFHRLFTRMNAIADMIEAEIAAYTVDRKGRLQRKGEPAHPLES